MRLYLAAAFSIVTLMLPAFAEDTVPYAYRPLVADDTYIPGLGNIMQAIQWRHIKLSYAGKLSNWDLARYELGQVAENLSDAVRLYRNIPIEQIKMIDPPLVALSDAINAKAGARFARAFVDLTNACNACHMAAQVSYIDIQVPAASPFADQSFTPKGK
jgi:hypothetical protein